MSPGRNITILGITSLQSQLRVDVSETSLKPRARPNKDIKIKIILNLTSFFLNIILLNTTNMLY